MVDNVNKDRLLKTLNQGIKFKFVVDAIGRTIKMREQVTVIEMFKGFPFKNEDVDLQNPQITYKCFECMNTGTLFFGVKVASCRHSEKSGKNQNDDTFYGKYDLKFRPYLGPTSTDHVLAMLMANQAQIKDGDMVYDPFLGTGSIAIAC